MSPVCVSMWFTLIVPCDLESSDPLWKAGIWCCCSPQPSEPFSTLWLRGRNGLQWLGKVHIAIPLPSLSLWAALRAHDSKYGPWNKGKCWSPTCLTWALWPGAFAWSVGIYYFHLYCHCHGSHCHCPQAGPLWTQQG